MRFENRYCNGISDKSFTSISTFNPTSTIGMQNSGVIVCHGETAETPQQQPTTNNIKETKRTKLQLGIARNTKEYIKTNI